MPTPLRAPLATVLLVVLASAASGQFAPAADPKAIELAARAMDAMGGREALNDVHLLRFDFAVERDGEVVARFAHWWDRFTGAYRLEGTDRDSGEPFRVLFDIDDRQGRAWIGDRELEGEELATRLEQAYGRFINDSYWLLMPWKWLDPGVNASWQGGRSVDGTTYEVVQLTFGDEVGLTSNDRYWGLVNPASGRMERWEYVLQTETGEPGEGEPTRWAWEGWQETEAGIQLSTEKRRLGDGPAVLILFPVAEARAEIGDAELAAELMTPLR